MTQDTKDDCEGMVNKFWTMYNNFGETEQMQELKD